jgi:hypothetical protein
MTCSNSAAASPAPIPVATTATPPAKPHTLLTGILVLLTLAYFFWTAICWFEDIPEIRPKGHPETDHFNLLSHGFLKGHLHLAGEVPEALIRAPNPYDPKNRGNVEVLHDASYYKGKYYIYFGPGPVVALLLPFRILTGRDLPLPYGVWLFTSIGYLALVGIFRQIQGRYFPRASAWSVAAGLIAIGGASMLVALLRRPHIWEFPASAGFCFFALSLWCLVRALHSPRPIRWTALGGLALGMAVASRPTYILCSVLYAVPLLLRDRARYQWRDVFAAAAGCSLIVLGLFAYNYARFANPFEFGQKYQLSAIIEGDAQHFSLGYVLFNLRVYFLSGLRWLDTFPFHHGILLPPQPPGHGGYEYAIGILPNLPFAWFALIGIATIFWRQRDVSDDQVRRLTIGIILLAALLQTAVLICYFGTCIRYMADFTPAYMLVSAFGVLAAEHALRSRVARCAVRLTSLVLALISSFVAAMSVVNIYDQPAGSTPGAYDPVARFLNRPTFWWKTQRSPDYGPLELGLAFHPDRATGHETLVTITRDQQITATVFVDYQPEGKIRLGYREPDPRSEVFSPPFERKGEQPHRLRLSIGGPYREFNGRKSTLRAEIDGRPLWDLPVVSLAAFPGRLEIASSSAQPFTGKVLSVRRLSEADFERPRPGGVRLRITLTPSMANRTFPLVATGKAKAGDLLFFRVGENGSITLGYDHWGDALRLSPEIPFGFGQPRSLELWVPATASQVIAKLDGTLVWQQEAPAFAMTERTFYVGANAIGATTAEPVLENAVLEGQSLPKPAEM